MAGAQRVLSLFRRSPPPESRLDSRLTCRGPLLERADRLQHRVDPNFTFRLHATLERCRSGAARRGCRRVRPIASHAAVGHREPTNLLARDGALAVSEVRGARRPKVSACFP